MKYNKVLERIECHYYSSDERPFFAVKVLVGETMINGKSTPIIRWMTEEQYEHTFNNKEGD